MPRILVCNNYPLDRVREEVTLGETPDQGLFGINYFHRRGYEVEIVPLGIKGWGQRLGALLGNIRFPIPVGDLSQEFHVLGRLNEADLIYAPCDSQTHLLQYLRATGLLRVPVVCLMHHPFLRGKLDFLRVPFRRLFAAGADALPALSAAVAEEMGSLYGAGTRAFPLAWGPDLGFYPAVSKSGRGVVAAGRTGRDFITFGRAASLTNSRATIICLDGQLDATARTFGPNVEILVQSNQEPVPGTNAGWMKYPDLLRIYSTARALAIPLMDQKSLAGLTSLMDALGLGKPVLMSRNRHIDLDIEAEGIGIWVKPGDISGWVRAIQWMDNHEDEALEMGRRARRLAERSINSVTFADSLMDIFDAVLGRGGATGHSSDDCSSAPASRFARSMASPKATTFHPKARFEMAPRQMNTNSTT